MPPFTGLEFGLAPREPRTLYRRFLATSSIAAARRCRTELAPALDAAERAHGVSANVVAALLYVETGCGRNTGGSPTLFSLARLAMANEPENLRDNVERHTGGIGDVVEVDEAVTVAVGAIAEVAGGQELRIAEGAGAGAS